MEAATLYLIYVAAMGGPEKRVIKHYDDEKECRVMLEHWESNARVSGRYKVMQAACLTAEEYNTKIGVFSTDILDEKYRR